MLGGAVMSMNGLAERLEQRAIDGVLLRIVLSVPLDAERERWRIGRSGSTRISGIIWPFLWRNPPVARSLAGVR